MKNVIILFLVLITSQFIQAQDSLNIFEQLSTEVKIPANLDTTIQIFGKNITVPSNFIISNDTINTNIENDLFIDAIILLDMNGKQSSVIAFGDVTTSNSALDFANATADMAISMGDTIIERTHENNLFKFKSSYVILEGEPEIGYTEIFIRDMNGKIQMATITYTEYTNAERLKLYYKYISLVLSE